MPTVAKEITELFSKFEDSKLTNLFASDEYAQFYKSTSDNTFKEWVKNLGNSERESLSAADALAKYTEHVQASGKATSKFQTIVKSAGSALKTLGSFAVNTLASMAVSWAIGKAIEGITNYINRVEIAIEKGQEAADASCS